MPILTQDELYMFHRCIVGKEHARPSLFLGYVEDWIEDNVIPYDVETVVNKFYSIGLLQNGLGTNYIELTEKGIQLLRLLDI